jgi:hypothetical protein
MPSLPSVRRCCGQRYNLNIDGKSGAENPPPQAVKTARRLERTGGLLFLENQLHMKGNK